MGVTKLKTYRIECDANRLTVDGDLVNPDGGHVTQTITCAPSRDNYWLHVELQQRWHWGIKFRDNSLAPLYICPRCIEQGLLPTD